MIYMNDFKKEYKTIRASMLRTIDTCLSNGYYILGPTVRTFEETFARYIGTKYCVGTANGLEALQIALLALGIGPGDEVITVSNSDIATALAISHTGAKPVFVDIDEYYHMDPHQIERVITKHTKAILPVHLFGQLADIIHIKKIAQKHHLYLVEDACQAHGARLGTRMAGSFGDIGCFSFYPTKNLGAYGDAGALTTNSETLYKKCLALRNRGEIVRYNSESQGITSRLDELQAAILLNKIQRLPTYLQRRRRNAQEYIRLLADVRGVTLPHIRAINSHSFHLFVIRANHRSELQTYLREHHIETLIHYPVPIHKQGCYNEYHAISLPATERVADEILSLPIHPMLKLSEVVEVSTWIRKFYHQ